jgi:hypothetical protein
MKAFIFVTREGYTYQPLSESAEPDIENLQVLGFANGENAASAFSQLVADNTWLAETSFREVFSLELAYEDFERRARFFRLPSEAGD